MDELAERDEQAGATMLNEATLADSSTDGLDEIKRGHKCLGAEARRPCGQAREAEPAEIAGGQDLGRGRPHRPRHARRRRERRRRRAVSPRRCAPISSVLALWSQTARTSPPPPTLAAPKKLMRKKPIPYLLRSTAKLGTLEIQTVLRKRSRGALEALIWGWPTPIRMNARTELPPLPRKPVYGPAAREEVRRILREAR